ncbi:5-formyltetrahydrofolate cyclo-ligase [Phocaeicola sartorii]|uniref:5-formyltetrahydrofolate cyclo-ligase n=1 Tax=Phocaeicola sartorii TaxID=671267 RepID=UPI003516E069
MKKKNNPEENPQEKITDMSIYIAALSTTFAPAADPARATHWLTTEEVVKAIKELDPFAQVSQDEIFRALWDAGYRFGQRPCAQGLSFRWMMIEKTK